jgi:hypothetical protein
MLLGQFNFSIRFFQNYFSKAYGHFKSTFWAQKSIGNSSMLVGPLINLVVFDQQSLFFQIDDTKSCLGHYVAST